MQSDLTTDRFRSSLWQGLCAIGNCLHWSGVDDSSSVNWTSEGVANRRGARPARPPRRFRSRAPARRSDRCTAERRSRSRRCSSRGPRPSTPTRSARAPSGLTSMRPTARRSRGHAPKAVRRLSRAGRDSTCSARVTRRRRCGPLGRRRASDPYPTRLRNRPSAIRSRRRTPDSPRRPLRAGAGGSRVRRDGS
jgi:hypothetical protein